RPRWRAPCAAATWLLKHYWNDVARKHASCGRISLAETGRGRDGLARIRSALIRLIRVLPRPTRETQLRRRQVQAEFTRRERHEKVTVGGGDIQIIQADIDVLSVDAAGYQETAAAQAQVLHRLGEPGFTATVETRLQDASGGVGADDEHCAGE